MIPRIMVTTFEKVGGRGRWGGEIHNIPATPPQPNNSPKIQNGVVYAVPQTSPSQKSKLVRSKQAGVVTIIIRIILELPSMQYFDLVGRFNIKEV